MGIKYEDLRTKKQEVNEVCNFNKDFNENDYMLSIPKEKDEKTGKAWYYLRGIYDGGSSEIYKTTSKPDMMNFLEGIKKGCEIKKEKEDVFKQKCTRLGGKVITDRKKGDLCSFFKKDELPDQRFRHVVPPETSETSFKMNYIDTSWDDVRDKARKIRMMDVVVGKIKFSGEPDRFEPKRYYALVYDITERDLYKMIDPDGGMSYIETDEETFKQWYFENAIDEKYDSVDKLIEVNLSGKIKEHVMGVNKFESKDFIISYYVDDEDDAVINNDPELDAGKSNKVKEKLFLDAKSIETEIARRKIANAQVMIKLELKKDMEGKKTKESIKRVKELRNEIKDLREKIGES